jgi:hypothetical protein
VRPKATLCPIRPRRSRVDRAKSRGQNLPHASHISCPIRAASARAPPREPAQACGWQMTYPARGRDSGRCRSRLRSAAGPGQGRWWARRVFTRLGQRGLERVNLMVSDGAEGVVRGAATVYPAAAHQLCLTHGFLGLAQIPLLGVCGSSNTPTTKAAGLGKREVCAAASFCASSRRGTSKPGYAPPAAS